MHVYRNILEHKTYDVIPVNEFTLKNSQFSVTLNYENPPKYEQTFL